jgi:hypothetical protein
MLTCFINVLSLWLTAAAGVSGYGFSAMNIAHVVFSSMDPSVLHTTTRGSFDMMDSVIDHECLHRHDTYSIGCCYDKLLELDRVVLCDTSKKLQSGNGEHVCMTCVHVKVKVNPIDDYGLVGSTRACASRCPCSSHSPRWPHVMLLLVLLPLLLVLLLLLMMMTMTE